jgi:hypothetical protein
MTVESSVKTILTQTTVLQTPEDAELGGRVRELVHKALEEVEYTLEFGSTRDKMTMLKALLVPAGRLIGVGATTQKEEARVAFESLMQELRDVPLTTQIVTEGGVEDVELEAAYEATHHQDEGRGGDEDAGRNDW